MAQTHVESPSQRILEATLELMTEYGYEGMSLQRVADRVGLHKSTLFHHFSSKEEIAQEVFRGVCEPLLDLIEPGLASDPPELAHLLRVSDEMVDHFARQRWAARFLMRFLVAHPHDEAFHVSAGDLEHPVNRILTLVGGWLDRARNAGVTRPIKVRHTLIDVLATALFYPSIAHDVGAALVAEDPWSDKALRDRKRELRSFLKGALEP